ncbi:tetratricopeptide repeat protein [Aliarcobacter skirrowii]|uniref:Tetratricopeptide repeat protein n=1 Tax=Aliarcobacter skirrowii TaxID=28200 RepID=A0AAW9DDB0_9BACT|nr:hypothetical protein [Aliarcobacter skirrowii]MDX4070022.1 hypothetical protein [Aliarcobacter skirrowii]
MKKNYFILLFFVLIVLSFLYIEVTPYIKDKKLKDQIKKELLLKEAIEKKRLSNLIKPKYEKDKEKRSKIWYVYQDYNSATQLYKYDIATEIARAYYEQLQNYEKAMEWIEYSNSIVPTAENSRQACIVLQNMKKFEESISWCTQGHELGDDLSLLGIALAYRGVKNYEEALNWAFIANEKQIPGSADVIGLAYSALSDYVNAEKWFLQAIKDDPKDSRALNNLISFYIEDLNDKIRGAAYAIASVNNVFPAHTIGDFLVGIHQIPLEDLQKAYELQLNTPILPYKYEEKERRLGFLNEKDYKSVLERYIKRNTTK